MILGIGFIMIAGICPVAISQVQSTNDESVAAVLARNGTAMLAQSVPWKSLVQTDGAMLTLQSLPPAAAQAVNGNLICQSDPRYAWIPLIRYQGLDYPAQIVLIVVRNQDGRAFGNADLVGPDPATSDPATLEPRVVDVALTDGGNGPDTVEFEPTYNAGAAAPGAYLVIGTDRASGMNNGHIYRLGNQIDAAGLKWELSPGNDLPNRDFEVFGARAYIVGRPLADPTKPNGGFRGPAQDVAVYSAYVSPRR